MNTKYFTHRILALVLTLFLSYSPIFWKVISTEKLSLINIMKHEEIIFSLLALLASCLFDLFENDLQHTTLKLSLLVIEIILITASIFLYIYQINDINDKTNCWKYNGILLFISIGLYVLSYKYISKNRKYSENDISSKELDRLFNTQSMKR